MGGAEGAGVSRLVAEEGPRLGRGGLEDEEEEEEDEDDDEE